MKKKRRDKVRLAAALVLIFLLGGCAKQVSVESSVESAEVTEATAAGGAEISSEAVSEIETEPEPANPLRIYLVRHGQTYSNIKDATVGGGGNAQLTEKGRTYAYSLGLAFEAEGIEFQAAYSSTLDRTKETAAQILRGNGQNLEVIQCEELKDISWGAAEGGRSEDLKEVFFGDLSDFAEFFFGSNEQTDFVSPMDGAEPAHDYSARIDQILRRIAGEYEENGGNILVVGHSSLGYYLHQYLAEGKMSGLANTSTSILEYREGEFTLVDYDNVDYLNRGIEMLGEIKPLEVKIITTPQTIFKSAGVLEGTSDSDLNERGLRQAHELNKVLKEMPIAAVYCSTLGRSKETAEIGLDNISVNVTEEAGLNELFLGYWETERVHTLEESDAGQLAMLLSASEILSFTEPDGDGEHPLIAAYRLKQVLQEIGTRYQSDESTVVVFTHPYILKAYLNKAFPDYEVETSDDMQIFSLQYVGEAYEVIGCETIKISE